MATAARPFTVVANTTVVQLVGPNPRRRGLYVSSDPALLDDIFVTWVESIARGAIMIPAFTRTIFLCGERLGEALQQPLFVFTTLGAVTVSCVEIIGD